MSRFRRALGVNQLILSSVEWRLHTVATETSRRPGNVKTYRVDAQGFGTYSWVFQWLS